VGVVVRGAGIACERTHNEGASRGTTKEPEGAFAPRDFAATIDLPEWRDRRGGYFPKGRFEAGLMTTWTVDLKLIRVNAEVTSCRPVFANGR
jgi:hypothetical protein